MSNHIFPSALAVLVVTTALLPVSAAQTVTVYHSFTQLAPSRSELIEDAWLVVADERILRTGTGEPPGIEGSRYRDMSGLYALPGFIDAHAHITSGPLTVEVTDGVPGLSMESMDRVTRFHALTSLASGVTTIRNPAGDPEANANYDRQLDAGVWRGPDAQHAGFTFDPVPIAGGSVYPRDEKAWDTEILRQKELGMEYIKLYTGLSEAELELGIEKAHEHGLETIAHLDRVSWTRAIELGIDALTHALPTSAELLQEPQRSEYLTSRNNTDSRFMFEWFELVDYDSEPVQTLIRELVENEVELDLTLIVNELSYFFDEIDTVHPEEDRGFVHPLVMQTWFQNMAISHTGWTQEDFERAHKVMPKVLEFARRLHEAGVRLLPGTDGYGGGPFYARELALHVEAGIHTWDVLQMATSLAAERLGLEQTGSLEPGLEADVVFLTQNPLDDINNVRQVHTVVNNGHHYRAEDLLARAESFASLEP